MLYLKLRRIGIQWYTIIYTNKITSEWTNHIELKMISKMISSMIFIQKWCQSKHLFSFFNRTDISNTVGQNSEILKNYKMDICITNSNSGFHKRFVEKYFKWKFKHIRLSIHQWLCSHSYMQAVIANHGH